MSSYYPSFNYKGINSRDKNFVVAHFEADQGETDTFLGMEPIYTESADGSSRIDYGARFNNVAVFKITMIKQSGEDFSVADVRDCLKWLTGARTNSPLDLTEHFIEDSSDIDSSLICDGSATQFKLFHQCDHAYYVKINGVELKSGWAITTDVNASFIVFDEAPSAGAKITIAYNRIKYSFIGRVTNAWQQKMDSRTVGIVLEFTSASPWAFSRSYVISQDIYGTESAPEIITINNESDEQYAWLYLKTTFSNEDGTYLKITNTTTGEDPTIVKNIAYNETVTIDGNKMITSNKSGRIFGNDFNFNFPRLCSGINKLYIVGIGHIKIEYIMPLKAGDCAIDASVLSDPICNESGEIVLDCLDWSRITGTPNSLSGYGITNAYTKTEVDTKISNATVKEISWGRVVHKPTDLAGYGLDDDVYTKTEINTKLQNVDKDIDDLAIYLKNNYLDSNEIMDKYYNKIKIDDIVSKLTYDPETGTGGAVLWAQIVDKPTTLAEYSIYTEVRDMIDQSISSFSIDEEELNTMLAEVLV